MGADVMCATRQNVTAEYESWRRAQLFGDWGTTPSKHRPEAAHDASRDATELVSEARFAHDHRTWFARARASARAAGSPILELRTEALVAARSYQREMARVSSFLGLPPFEYRMPVRR